MDSILTTGSRMSHKLRHLPTTARRWFKYRGRWPMPEDFDRMSPEHFDRYIRSIGFDERAVAAMAEYRGAQDQSRVDAGVQASQTSHLDRRDPPGS
jgi:hypothetical protein